MSLSFDIKKGQRIDLWLKEAQPTTQPLFVIHVNGTMVFKIQEASRYYQYFTWTAWQDGVAHLEWLAAHSEMLYLAPGFTLDQRCLFYFDTGR